MRLSRLALFIFFTLLLWTSPALAQDEPPPDPISLDSYWGLVAESRQTLRQLRGQGTDEAASRLANLAQRWQRVESVQMPDGQVIPLDTGPLVLALGAVEPNVLHLEKLFETLELERQKHTPRAVPGDAEGKLKNILARPEFQYAEASPNPLDELLARFIEWWLRLFGVDDGVVEISLPILQVVSVILLMAALFFIFRNIYMASVTDIQADGDTDGDEALTAETAFKKAQTLSSAGDNRTAVRYLYLSSLLLLDERGLLRYDRTKTNREYLRGISDRPHLAGPLRDVVDVFDRVWYGFKSLDNETFEQYVERVKELREQKHE